MFHITRVGHCAPRMQGHFWLPESPNLYLPVLVREADSLSTFESMFQVMARSCSYAANGSDCWVTPHNGLSSCLFLSICTFTSQWRMLPTCLRLASQVPMDHGRPCWCGPSCHRRHYISVMISCYYCCGFCTSPSITFLKNTYCNFNADV